MSTAIQSESWSTTEMPGDGGRRAYCPLVTSPFDKQSVVATSSEGSLTLVNGRTFAISDSAGNIERADHGVVFEDLRMLSVFKVGVASGDGSALATQVLSASAPTPFSAVFVSSVEQDGEDGSRDVLIRRRWLGRGIRENIEIHNSSPRPSHRRLMVSFATDFAHLFDVKAGRQSDDEIAMATPNGSYVLSEPGSDTTVRIESDPPATEHTVGALLWELEVAPKGSSTISLTCEPCWDGEPAGLLFPMDESPAEALPVRQQSTWERAVPTVLSSAPSLDAAVSRCLGDLASLRIFDKDHADRTVVAAGAPWFMTLFGRDSLITSWMALPFAPELANGVLMSLAELQGARIDEESEEAPGKIIHELRRRGGSAAFGERGRYYGTVDATPLFVMLVAEAHRWGALSDEEVSQLWPAVQLAMEWLTTTIDNDPHGLVSYRRSTPQGLSNQGWKDSWDGINYQDGRIARGRIALAEVQGYAFAAFEAAKNLVTGGLVDSAASDFGVRAEALRERFEDMFWNEESQWYVVGIDERGDQIDALTSNPGHALWCGIADASRANDYLDHLTFDTMWTGWGMRTLSSAMGSYDPMAYHNGSVWPHDTAICAAGAAAYGRWDVVDRIVTGSTAAASHFGGRPPELFAGFADTLVPSPVPYPSSCSPQAWASASVLMNLRTLTGLEPDPGNGIRVTRPVASAMSALTIDGIRAGSGRYRLEMHEGLFVSSHLP